MSNSVSNHPEMAKPSRAESIIRAPVSPTGRALRRSASWTWGNRVSGAGPRLRWPRRSAGWPCRRRYLAFNLRRPRGAVVSKSLPVCKEAAGTSWKGQQCRTARSCPLRASDGRRRECRKQGGCSGRSRSAATISPVTRMALRPGAKDRPICIFGDRHVGMLELSRLVDALRRIARILWPSQYPPDQARHLHVATPRAELSTRHMASPRSGRHYARLFTRARR